MARVDYYGDRYAVFRVLEIHILMRVRSDSDTVFRESACTTVFYIEKSGTQFRHKYTKSDEIGKNGMKINNSVYRCK